MKHGLKRLLLAFGLAAFCATPFAVFDPVNDDTDLFRNNPNIPSERPNVLIILDNTANWNTAFTNEKSALVSVVNSLDSAFNVGLMLFPETGGGNDSIDGGYVKFGMRQMTDGTGGTANNKGALATIVGNLDKLNDKGNNSTIGLAMHEAYLYFGGRVNRASYGKVKTDFAGNTVNNPLAAGLAGNALAANPTAVSVYNPAMSDACQKNYIIFISNGPTNENASARATGETLLTAARGGSAPSIITISPNGQQPNWADEYAKFMAENDISGTLAGTQSAITYVVEVDPGSTGQAPDMTALAKSMAQNGKGKYFAVTSGGTGQAIIDALNSIFQEIQAVNSVFAASTLPVSVNVRGTNLNQLYIGVFRPDAGDKPRWLGNLKAYQLKKDATSGAVFTVDKNLNPAINSSTGFITSSAVSFWTSPSAPNSTYWSFRPAAANGVGGSSDSPDGDLVEKGGAAQQLRAKYFAAGINAVAPDPSRPLYTCTQGPAFPLCNTDYSGTSSLLSATPFTDANTDIDAGSLAINTRQVSPLTAAVTKPITALTDTRPVTLDNTSGAVFSPYAIQTNSDSRYYFTLDNTRTVSVTSLSNGAVSKTLTAITVANGSNKVAVATSAAHGYGVGQTVLISGTTNFNGSRIITAATTNTFSFGSFTGPISESTGTSTTSNTIVNVTAPAHGFINNQSVTIAGATPTSFNGVKTIAFIDANTFSYGNSVSAGASGTITATGLSDTVKATIDTSWGFASHGHTAGETITINNAVPSAYNGTYTVLSSPAPTATTFSFKTPTTITTPSTGTFVYTTFSGSIATPFFFTLVAPGFTNGATVFISGASPAGFNGTFTISNVIDYGNVGAPYFNCCPGYYSFDYTVPSGLGFSASQASAGIPIQVAGSTSSTVTASLVNHGFTAGTFITIAGASPVTHNGSWQVTNVIDANTFQYSTVAALNAPSGTPTTRLTTSPRAYATIAGHGYGAAGTTIGTFIVASATPSGYNGTFSARVEDADTVSYPLSGGLGTYTGAPTATTLSTTAVATSTAHGFAVGQTVTISGATPSAFNGAFTIATTPSLDTFTYTLGSAQGAATGSINALSSGAGASERTAVINWVRGEDNFEDENANSSFADTRASMHGDVLHSRPAVVNYNRRGASDPVNADNDVYIFYGGNDGVFRAAKGGFASTTGDPAPGVEVWGFIAKEHFGNLKRLRLNSPTIGSNFKKPYFFDGPIGAYTQDASPAATPDGKLIAADGDKVWLYLTMRRGGRAIYALDVSDPLVPKMLWRKGCPSLSTVAADIDITTGCDLGWAELGQTWSEPKVISINATTDPVLMFGAGYDPLVEDLDPSSVTSATSASVVASGTTYTRSMGRGIYVVNARTGAIIWQAAGQARTDASTHPYRQVSGMDFAIPSDIAVVLGDTRAFAPNTRIVPFRSYVGDTGGNMWRVDFGDADPAKWTVVKLASVGDLTTAAGRRKFLFPPDVINSTGSDMVIAGTGDREHPFDATVVNRVYAFKDKVASTTPAADVLTGVPLQATITHTATAMFNGSSVSTLLNVTNNCIQVAANCGTNGMGAPEIAVGGSTASQNTASALAASTNLGWFISLAAGEKQVGGTLGAGGGAVFFGTNQPSASAGGGSCSPNLGVARQYSVNFENGTAFTGTSLSTTYAGGGFLPSPVLVYVGLGGATGTGTSTTGGVPVGGTVSGGQLRIGAGASLGGGNDPTGVVCYGASCSLAPGVQLYSRLRKFWYKEID